MTSPVMSMEVDLSEVHDLSIDILENLEEGDSSTGIAMLALIMTLGRLMAPEVMSEEQEVKFIQNVFDFAGSLLTDSIN